MGPGPGHNGTLVATDVDNLTLTYALGAQATNGTVVVNSDGSYTYTPNLNFNGTDSFTFTASDGTVGSNAATVTLTVAAVNDAPVNTVPGPQTAQEDTPLLITGLSVADVDSPTLTVTLSALNGSVAIVPGLALIAGNLTGTATITGTLAEVNLALASVYYQGNPNFFGPDTLTMTTSDGALSDIDPSRSRSPPSQTHRCSTSTPTIRAARRDQAIKPRSPRTVLRLRSPTPTSCSPMTARTSWARLSFCSTPRRAMPWW